MNNNLITAFRNLLSYKSPFNHSFGPITSDTFAKLTPDKQNISLDECKNISLCTMIVILDNMGYNFSQKELSTLFNGLLYNKSKSFLFRDYGWDDFSKCITIIFNKYTPTKAQMNTLINSYLVITKDARSVLHDIFLPIKTLLMRGYVLSDDHKNKLLSIHYDPDIYSLDATIPALETLLNTKNIYNNKNQDYILYLINKIDTFDGNTTIINNIIKNVPFIDVCFECYKYGPEDDICDDCSDILLWKKVICELINKNATINIDTLCTYMNNNKKRSDEPYTFFFDLISLKSIELNEDIFNLAIKNQLSDIAFYVAEKHLVQYFEVTADILAKITPCNNGIIRLYHKDLIEKYCSVYQDNIWYSHTIVDFIQRVNSDDVDDFHYVYDSIVEHMLHGLDPEDNLSCTDPKYNIGYITIRDIVTKNNIKPNIDLMNSAIKNHDMGLYNECITKYKIVPNTESINNALKLLNPSQLPTLLEYKILPNEAGFCDFCNYTSENCDHNSFTEMFECLVKYGFILTENMLRCVIKNDLVVSNLYRFKIVIDSKIYYYLYLYEMIIKYQDQFDSNLMELNKKRMAFKDYTKEDIKAIIENKGYIDRYCVDIAYHYNLPAYIYLLKKGFEPMLQTFVIGRYQVMSDNKSRKVFIKAIKNMVNKLYGSKDDAIKLMGTPYDL